MRSLQSHPALDPPSTPHATLHLRTDEHAQAHYSDMLDNPKTPAHSSLSRIAIYHAPLAANIPHKQPKTGQRGQKGQKRCRNDFSKVHPLPKLDHPSLSFDGCRGSRRCRQNKNLPTPFPGTILHARELSPLPSVILSIVMTRCSRDRTCVNNYNSHQTVPQHLS